MPASPKISALICVHNEASQMKACLAPLASFVDQIVVVLDRCTDASKDVALAHKAKIVEGAWPIEGHRRQAGQDACSGRWIFEIDADERVSPELIEEIKQLIDNREAQGDHGPDWWRIPFDNYIGERLVRHGWGAQFGVGAKAILYKKGYKTWGNQRVHPKVQMRGESGPALTHRMKHLVDENVSDMIQRLDRYTTLRALDLIDEGNIGTFKKNVARIFGRFYKCFILRKGYKEGALGLVIAIFAGLYPFLSFVKAAERHKSTL
ncbi:MAG: glycosyltransferase family 2 protein [Alphaproteobacteria bacterium]|nr:glycosyltransferase family 2 protein [Alphaproteobacteria bacterium]